MPMSSPYHTGASGGGAMIRRKRSRRGAAAAAAASSADAAAASTDQQQRDTGPNFTSRRRGRCSGSSRSVAKLAIAAAAASMACSAISRSPRDISIGVVTVEASTVGYPGTLPARTGTPPSRAAGHYRTHATRRSTPSDDGDATGGGGGGGGGGTSSSGSDSESDMFDCEDQDSDSSEEFGHCSSAATLTTTVTAGTGNEKNNDSVMKVARAGGAANGDDKASDTTTTTSSSSSSSSNNASEQSVDATDSSNIGDKSDGESASASTSNEQQLAKTDSAPIVTSESGQSQPLRTLKKLQAMLDDSDYATATSSSITSISTSSTIEADQQNGSAKVALVDEGISAVSSSDLAAVRATSSSSHGSSADLNQVANTVATAAAKSTANVDVQPPSPPSQTQQSDQGISSSTPGKLWTSKDRSKYKRQRRLRQERERREKEQLEAQRRKWQQMALSDKDDDTDGDDATDGTLTDGTTEDDGLGYTLPNLPVYLSDSEGNSDELELLDPDQDDQEYVSPAAQFQQRQSMQQMPQNPSSSTAVQDRGRREPTSTSTNASSQSLLQQQQLQPSEQPTQGYPHQQQYQQPYYPDQQLQQQQYQQRSPSSTASPQQQQQQGQYAQAPHMNYPYPYPGPYGSAQYGQQQYAQQYAAWAASATAAASSGQPYPPPPPPQRQHGEIPPPPPMGAYQNYSPRPYPQYRQGGFMPQSYVPHGPSGIASTHPATKAARSKAGVKSKGSEAAAPLLDLQRGRSQSQEVTAVPPPNVSFIPPVVLDGQPAPNDYGRGVSLAEASANISFDSIQKLVFLMVGVMLMSYCAVSPRTLPLVEYNRRFKENLQTVSLVLIAPLVTSLSVFDAKESDINQVISTFTSSFSLGYILSFMLEIVWTTVLRLGVFLIWEPAIFKLTPAVPTIVLPWVLRDNKYRPKRITLFAADFVTSCVAAPIIEEYIKLKIVQLSGRLPRNYKRVKRKHSTSKRKKKKRFMLERIERPNGEPEVTNVNVYVTKMLAASVGLKLCDSVRRILMYTKRTDVSKSFYAFARGIFPIHELCGTMTALELARRDLLGVDLPLWRVLLPAVFIHGMANFRGMKPIFKWNSATPWSEMQLSPWNVADDSTFGQMLNKGFAKMMWLVILGRVLGYCIKNYYLIGRQAVKRTTTYAGKHAAFSAQLAAADYLKKTKKKD